MVYSFSLFSQEIVLRKGVIINDLQVNDSLAESFSLYLPQSFETVRNWPIVFVFDMQGKGEQAMGMFRKAADEEGYILASPNNVNDSLSVAKNIIISSRMFQKVYGLLPIDPNGIFTAGFASGGRLASVIPNFVKGISGVISCGASIPNVEILSTKNPFYYIGIVGNEDYNYSEMRMEKKLLNGLRFPNRLFVFEGGQEWPTMNYLQLALRTFSLNRMSRKNIDRDSTFITATYKEALTQIQALKSNSKLVAADDFLSETIQVYRVFDLDDSLKTLKRTLRKNKLFKTRNRNRNAAFFKENLIKDDYQYYLEEDVRTYNFNNLGWWKYQMEELDKYKKGNDMFVKAMGSRLRGYLNALTSDYIDATNAEKKVDLEALTFLWMLKTIIAPQEYRNYLNIISSSAQVEDYGTAIFYLEELLKNGYTNRKELYALEHTALFRITPEFNEIVAKYLKEARYDIIEE